MPYYTDYKSLSADRTLILAMAASMKFGLIEIQNQKNKL